MTVQFVELGGEKHALMPIADYERLLLELEDASDVQTAVVAEERRMAGEEYLPEEFLDSIMAGQSLLKTWRKHRGLKLRNLSEATSFSMGYISQLELGKRQGNPKIWRALAKALETDVNDIMPDDQA